MAKKEKPKKQRAEKYDTKLALNAKFDEVIKAIVKDPKKKL